MDINADFSRRAIVHAARLDWVASPIAGVDRRMLDRIGDEVARATSVVRYAPHSRFAAHTHGGGEEFLVLEGVFEDEHGACPAGSYVRNPPQSQHTPGSTPGCVILVKLWQFDPDDRTHVRIDASKMAGFPRGDCTGVTVTPLFRDSDEDVRLETWPPGAAVPIGGPDGWEGFVLDGGFTLVADEAPDAAERFEPHSWLRLPRADRVTACAGADGARLWIKSGHLRETPRAPA